MEDGDADLAFLSFVFFSNRSWQIGGCMVE